MISIQKIIDRLNTKEPIEISEDDIVIKDKFHSIPVVEINGEYIRCDDPKNKDLINSYYPPSEQQNIPIYETLVDKFLNILDQDLIYHDSKQDQILNKIEEFCERNNLRIRIQQSNILSAQLRNDIIDIQMPPNTSNKELVYIILHELSHYITNKSSSNKLLKFIKEPQKNNVDINNKDSLIHELDYFLNPSELANWAFTLSLYVYEFSNKTPSQLYEEINLNSSGLKNPQDSSYYASMPNQLRVLYHLIFYVNKLKSLGERSQKEYRRRLIQFIKLLDKYVKRLRKKLGN